MANEMTDLVNKIERRLGTKPINLPTDIAKDKWADEVIIPDTLTTFSRYFPHMVRIKLDTKNKNGDYYLIDEDYIGNVKILGVRDIAFDQFGADSTYLQQASGLGVYDYMSSSSSYSLDDVMLLQGRADMTSIFNNQVYLEFKEPNMVKLTSVTGADITKSLKEIPIDVFIMHSPNLMTISPTQMEVFEELAIADVANFLRAYLQHFDGLETVFGTIDLKLMSLERYADTRQEIVQKLADAYISPANKNQPIMFTV